MSESSCETVKPNKMPPKEKPKDNDNGGVPLHNSQSRWKDKKPVQSKATASKKPEPKGKAKEEDESVSNAYASLSSLPY
jgi:hypothetical protein